MTIQEDVEKILNEGVAEAKDFIEGNGNITKKVYKKPSEYKNNEIVITGYSLISSVVGVDYTELQKTNFLESIIAYVDYKIDITKGTGESPEINIIMAAINLILVLFASGKINIINKGGR